MKRWQEHYLGVEATIAIVAAIALAGWMLFFAGDRCLDNLMVGNRANIYGTTATIAGTLLGFSIAGASLILGLVRSPQMAMVRENRHYPKLWTTFIQAARYLGLLTITALVGLLVDRENDSVVWLMVPFSLFAGLSVVRLVRMIWIVENVFNIIAVSKS